MIDFTDVTLNDLIAIIAEQTIKIYHLENHVVSLENKIKDLSENEVKEDDPSS